MGKRLKYNPLFTAREEILFAAIFYLWARCSNIHLDWIVLLAVVLSLIYALGNIIKEKNRFKWDKAILGCFISWTILKVGFGLLSGYMDNIEWSKSVLPVLDNITLVFGFVAMFTMCFLMFTYLILQKRGKWNFTISADMACTNCMVDYCTIMMLLVSCSKAL